MKIDRLATAAAVAAALLASAGAAAAGTLNVSLGQSAENFTLYGQGAIAPGIGSFTVGQGTGVYNPITNTSTFTLSGAITGGSAGYDSGTYAFITTYSGLDTPDAGPLAPFAQSNPSNTNQFFYNALDPSTTMTLDLFGTPTGSYVIPLVAGGSFLPGTGFGFAYVTTSCTGVATCGQNNVGLTPGAAIFGPVTISVTFPPTSTPAVPEPATWVMMMLGFAGLGLAGYRDTGRSAAAA